MAELYCSEALRDALREEMRRDENVLLIGEDIAGYGGAFGVTKGLLDEFGADRVRNTPISEGSFTGIAVGAALVGMRPVVEIMFMDFITLAFDQIVNHAAKFRFAYGEPVPLVVRTPAGGGRGYGPTHSQSLEAVMASIPGLKVVAPSNPFDSKGLLKSAIRDDNPVIFVENKALYQQRGEIPEEDYTVPLGKAMVVREGTDATVVTYSGMVQEALSAAEALAENDVGVEVVDLRTLRPMDIDTVVASIEKTGRLVVVEEGPAPGGIAGEVALSVFERAYYSLDAPIRRVAAADRPIPASPVLERATLPGAKEIAQAVAQTLEDANE
jgi:pyruvate/2-oxoglutarate/acetoin dehydrogenase E1 component